MVEDIKALRAIVEAMGLTGTSSQQPNTNWRNHDFFQILVCWLNPAQIAALAKCSKFGWKMSKVVYTAATVEPRACAIAMTSNGCAAWLLPDGTIDRAQNGRKTAYLRGDWKSVTL